MFKRFLPQRDTFFPAFRELAAKNHFAAEALVHMLQNLDESLQYAKKIASLEKQADDVARYVFDESHKTFVTPFDRDDIDRLTVGLDDVLDQINRTARRLVLYQINTLPADMLTLGDLVLQSSQHIKQSTDQLSKLSKSDLILKACHEIYELEEAADKLILTGISQLFSNEDDFKVLLKMKEIYESFQTIFKSCKDAADILRNIVLEYS